MRYRRLSPTGDYTFGQGQANYLINTPETVGQAVKTRLLLLTAEWFLDLTDGTPYSTEILGTNTRATRDLAVKARILKTPGVIQLVEYASRLIDRNFSVSSRIDTVFGETTVSVVL